MDRFSITERTPQTIRSKTKSQVLQVPDAENEVEAEIRRRWRAEATRQAPRHRTLGI